MSSPTIDFSKYESQSAPPQIDFSKYTAAPKQTPEDIAQGASMGPQETGVVASIDRFRHRVQDALRGGGRPDAAVEFLGGPALGPLNAAHGAAILPEHPIRGTNEVVRGVGQTLALPLAVANPGLAASAVPAGVVQQGVQHGLTALGVDPDVSEMAGNISVLAGVGAVKKAPQIGKSIQVVAKPLGKLPGVSKFVEAAQAIKEVPSGLKDAWSKSTPEAKAALVEKMQPRHEEIADLHAKLSDALAQARGISYSESAARLIDVPDLRVKPSQQAPQNLIDRPAAQASSPQPQAGGTFQVNPPEGAVTPSGKATPNMEIYNEPDVARKVPPKPTLLEELRQWDNIRKIHSQLEDQIGKGQDEIQQWMEDHNQQAAGAKSSGAEATAKARFKAARASSESKVNAVQVDDLQGGHAGGGVISAEEAARPGTNYVVSKTGELTAHGKQFAPESTPSGSSHVTALPDGSLRVNAGPKLNAAQESSLRFALKKQPFSGTPRVPDPTSETDMENILTDMVKQMKKNKAKSAKAGG